MSLKDLSVTLTHERVLSIYGSLKMIRMQTTEENRYCDEIEKVFSDALQEQGKLK